MERTNQLDRRTFCSLAAVGAAVGAGVGMIGTADNALAEKASDTEDAGAAGDASGSEPAAMPAQYYIDIIRPNNGEGRKILEEYRTVMEPCLEEGGAKLVHELVDPIMWLEHDHNNLVFVWQVDGGPEAMWEAGRHYTAEAEAWMSGIRGRCISVNRLRLAAPEDLDYLAEVSYQVPAESEE